MRYRAHTKRRTMRAVHRDRREIFFKGKYAEGYTCLRCAGDVRYVMEIPNLAFRALSNFSLFHPSRHLPRGATPSLSSRMSVVRKPARANPRLIRSRVTSFAHDNTSLPSLPPQRPVLSAAFRKGSLYTRAERLINNIMFDVYILYKREPRLGARRGGTRLRVYYIRVCVCEEELRSDCLSTRRTDRYGRARVVYFNNYN